MNKKFMKIMVITIPIITLAIIASQIFNSPAVSQDELLDMIHRNEQIEIEIAVPEDQEQGTTLELTWDELAELTSYQETLRTPIESTLGIKTDADQYWIKTGMIYQDNSGVIKPNNTLKGALQNKEFRTAVDNDEIISAFSDAACNIFTDLESDEEMTNFYMAINAYFNLLPTTEEGYTNPQNVLTRAQFMAMVMRAETPYEAGLKVKEDFQSAVGNSEYSVYAQYLVDYSYLNLSDKSLNNQTYNGNISRAEAIYMLMNHYYADELASLDTSKATLDDTKDGGDIATAQGYTKDYGKSYEIVYCINNPSAGVPTDIYKALVLAEQKGLINSETRFDEAITLEESVELLVNIYKTLPIDETTGEAGNGEYIYNEDTGKYEGESGYDYGMTWNEMEEDSKDGITGGDVYYYDDNTTYVIWTVGEHAGNRYELGDRLPTGKIYWGVTEEDSLKAIEMMDAE